MILQLRLRLCIVCCIVSSLVWGSNSNINNTTSEDMEIDQTDAELNISDDRVEDVNNLDVATRILEFFRHNDVPLSDTEIKDICDLCFEYKDFTFDQFMSQIDKSIDKMVDNFNDEELKYIFDNLSNETDHITKSNLKIFLIETSLIDKDMNDEKLNRIMENSKVEIADEVSFENFLKIYKHYRNDVIPRDFYKN
ncbi:uncharacterized protein LOC126905803 [Daktulosphaira vitifoliae]|uniref:uncharacterized protein LOC126905803 n=1 Tax=Daktulosphaira vitifoliae TaxID=58002 RepID=UPI0021AAC16D|nr:uncharacterized protein LOC126905803 [Daktulosphaira vitifoliae]